MGAGRQPPASQEEPGTGRDVLISKDEIIIIMSYTVYVI
jgi:hypothetical protein